MTKRASFILFKTTNVELTHYTVSLEESIMLKLLFMGELLL